MPSVPPQQWPPLWWHLFALPLLQFLHLSWLPLSLQVPEPGIHIHFQVLLKTICILVNLQVSFVISDILQCVGYHSNPHVNKIRAGNLEHPLGKLFSVSVDFLKVSFQKSMHTKKRFTSTVIDPMIALWCPSSVSRATFKKQTSNFLVGQIVIDILTLFANSSNFCQIKFHPTDLKIHLS